MKESYTEAFIQDKRYRFNTKQMAIEVDKGTAKKEKWQTHVQCKNSPELEAEWKKLTEPQAVKNVAALQAIGLNDGWTLENRVTLKQPADGEIIGVFTKKDGTKYNAVYHTEEPNRVCEFCALKLNAHDCPNSKEPIDGLINVCTILLGDWPGDVCLQKVEAATEDAGTRSACADDNDAAIRERLMKERDMVVGSAIYRVSHNEMLIKTKNSDKESWKRCYKAETLKALKTFWNGLKEENAKIENEPKEPKESTHAPAPAGETHLIPVQFLPGSRYTATASLKRVQFMYWLWTANAELSGVAAECGRFQGHDIDQSAPCESPLTALRLGLRCIMDDITDRLAKPTGVLSAKHLNNAFETLEDIVSDDASLQAMLDKNICGEPKDAAPQDAQTPPTCELLKVDTLEEAPEGKGVMLIDIDRIVDSPFQIRKIDPQSEYIRELAESIRENGLIHPLALRPIGGGNYELVAGHCRRAACRLIGKTMVRCEVREMDDAQAEGALIVENLQRKNLTTLEEADSIAHLLGRGMRPDEVAKKIGKSEKYVTRRRAMARITPLWRAFAEKFRCGPEFVERVARLPAAAADKIFAQCKDDPGVQAGLIEDLKHNITAMEHTLEGRPWAKRHAEWCEGCPKRSDAQRPADLFGEADADPDDEAPKCLDAECWKLKTANYIREQKTELKHEYGTLLTANYHTAYCYASAESKSNPVPVLILDGAAAGTVKWAPKPQAQEKAKPRVVTESDVRKAAYWEAVSRMVKELKHGQKHGKGKFKPELWVVVRLALTYGTESEIDIPSRSSAAEYAQQKLAADDGEALAAKLWLAVRGQIDTWMDGEYFFKNNVTPESMETQYREARALAGLLHLDDDTVEKACAPIRNKLTAKYVSDGTKGARK